MKAIVLRELGEPEVLRIEEVPDPLPGPGEVVVQLHAAALNRRDVWIRRGKYAGIKLPIILGSDGSGVVSAVGAGVDEAMLGRPVVVDPSLEWGDDPRAQGARYRILGLPDDGTYAEMVKVPAANVRPKPPGLSFVEAAAVPLASLTAYRALVTRAAVAAGERVLVTGIGGGVSTFALLIARHLGATVFVTSGSQAKLDRARALGAAGGVLYTSNNWTKELVRLMDGRGPDLVVDSAGGEAFEKAIEIAAPGGRIVTYGATTGSAREVEIRRIFWKQLTILGTTMGTAVEFEQMLRLYENGMRPVVDREFALEDAAAAHRRMEQAEQFGKIVLRIEHSA
jgi:zinc-binding alcohol dehydrogenase/oxidoreductase